MHRRSLIVVVQRAPLLGPPHKGRRRGGDPCLQTQMQKALESRTDLDQPVGGLLAATAN
jgi:hypothetical protein